MHNDNERGQNRSPTTDDRLRRAAQIATFVAERAADALVDDREIRADGGREIVPVPVASVRDATEYDGSEDCEYGCLRDAEYAVTVAVGASEATLYACRRCLNEAHIYPEHNGHVDREVMTDGGSDVVTFYRFICERCLDQDTNTATGAPKPNESAATVDAKIHNRKHGEVEDGATVISFDAETIDGGDVPVPKRGATPDAEVLLGGDSDE